MSMDNPVSESSALNTDSAAAAFAAILNPEVPEEKQEETAEAPVEEVKAEESQDETPEGESESEPMVTVKIDGKEVEIPLKEALNGYQRQADYTKKTQEVSNERREVEAEKARVQQERAHYAQNLQRLQVEVENSLQQQQQIDWQRLIDENPQEALRQQHLFQERQAKLQQVYSEQQRLAAINQAEAQERHASFLQQQQAELLAKLPDWKDEAKAKAEKTALKEYLLASGYESKDVDAVSDHRAVLMARKAMLYDQMISKAQVAAKKVQSVPKIEKPGTGMNPGLDKRGSAFQRLGKSGSIDDAAAVFASLL